MATQQVPIMSPIKGVVRAVNREGQPPETCWDAKNVLPYDRYGRKRLAQRGGLLRQFTNQMSANFVQGMIEAPNIIYPPQALTVPVYSILDLPGFGPFSTPGTVGPFLYNGPTGLSFTLQWEWDFSITYTLSVVRNGDDPWGLSSLSINMTIYFPLTDNPAQSLILLIGGGGNLTDFDMQFGSVAVSMALFVGDPSLSIVSWTRLTPFTMENFNNVGTAETGTITVSGKLILQSNGLFSLSMTPFDVSSVSPQTGSIPFGILNFPELNVQSVIVDPYAGGSGTTGATQTLSVTD